MSRRQFYASLSLSVSLSLGCATPKLVARVSLEPTADDATLITNVNVFDGERALGPRDVLIDDGVIANVAAPNTLERPAQTIDGAGHTLLPGFIDAHAHIEAHGEPIWDSGLGDRDAIAQAYVYSGVTTAIVMTGNAGQHALARRARARPPQIVAPHLYMTGPRLTAPEGFPINLFRAVVPWPISSLLTSTVLTAATPDQAREAVDKMARFRPEFCKITSDAFPPDLTPPVPTLTDDTLVAAIQLCASRGMRPTAHLGSPAEVMIAAHAGLALFAHPPTSAVLTDEQVSTLAALRVPFASTLLFMTSTARVVADGVSPLDREIATDAMLSTFSKPPADFTYPTLPAGYDVDGLLTRYEANLRANVVKLHKGGVPILVGTDAGAPGVIPGSSFHRELRALVDAGIAPVDALRSATSVAADFLLEQSGVSGASGASIASGAFTRPAFGRVARGQRADLLLVKGDPLVDMKATEAIVAVFLEGTRVKRERRP